MTDQPFNETAYDEYRSDLQGLDEGSLRRFEAMADTPAKQAAVRDALTELGGS
jgi:hypothetical protein